MPRSPNLTQSYAERKGRLTHPILQKLVDGHLITQYLNTVNGQLILIVFFYQQMTLHHDIDYVFFVLYKIHGYGPYHIGL